MAPMPHEDCSTLPIRPRERCGHCSIASAAPAGHSAPMPMPSSARNRNSSQNVGARPASKFANEYQAIEIISGSFRPTRSANQPEAVAPTRRIHKVIVKTAVTSTSGTLKSLAIGAMISRKTVKSKASRTQPSQAAIQACHCSRVGSFHHGAVAAASTAGVMAHPRIVADTYNLASTVLPTQGTSRRVASGYLDYNIFSERPIGRDDAQQYQTLTPIP